MTDNKRDAHLEHDDDLITNTSDNPYFGDVLQVRLSRRQALVGGMSASAAFLLGGSLSGCTLGDDDSPAPAPSPFTSSLGFTAIPKSLADAVSLASGYSASVLYALGDPIDNATAAWSDAGTETGLSYEKRSGDHHDGMAYFGMTAAGVWSASASDRAMLCVNHENITKMFLHANTSDYQTATRAEDAALKEINAHGVGIIEIAKNGSGKFEVNKASTRNRRITPNTPVELTGPVRGSRFTVTKYSTGGTAARGTINNCAHGKTPWGTYLTCEENWAGYFKRDAADDSRRTAADVTLLKRYGINQGAAGNNAWTTVTPAVSSSTVFSRWDASVLIDPATTLPYTTADKDFRNEPNTFGYVMEIDPFNPTATPRKRTALGRMGHENAEFGRLVAGQPVVIYTGDDATFEYIYKFVSDEPWSPADADRGMVAGDKYLSNGTLYVARFDADGTGEWIKLEHGSNGLDEDALYPFTSQAAVIVATRLAADVVGATRMDRPEWIAVNPRNGEVYCTLTNNTSRKPGQKADVDAANPRNYATDKGNVNGHIIRWKETGGRNDALTFAWDIYVFAARSTDNPATINVSGLTADNDLSSPDGLWFDPRGLLWIQTDDSKYTDVTNCMMLAAVPGTVGDGAMTAIGTQTTWVGRQPGTSLRRFLVGPKDCEITGVTMTPDHKTMFINIQHPGENTDANQLGTTAAYTSHWPHDLTDAETLDAANVKRPRSATIVITKDDGGVIGS